MTDHGKSGYEAGAFAAKKYTLTMKSKMETQLKLGPQSGNLVGEAKNKGAGGDMLSMFIPFSYLASQYAARDMF